MSKWDYSNKEAPWLLTPKERDRAIKNWVQYKPEDFDTFLVSTRITLKTRWEFDSVAQAAQDKLRDYQVEQAPEQVIEALADAICSDCLDVIREICPKLNDATDDYCPHIKNILAIIQPLIEAAEKRGIDMGVVAYETTCASLIEAARKEAYKEVGERLNEIVPYKDLRQNPWLVDLYDLYATLLNGELPKVNDK